MKVFEELRARGLLAQLTDEEEIRELVNEGKATFYKSGNGSKFPTSSQPVHKLPLTFVYFIFQIILAPIRKIVNRFLHPGRGRTCRNPTVPHVSPADQRSASTSASAPARIRFSSMVPMVILTQSSP